MADLEITVTAIKGKPLEIRTGGLVARIKEIQHERLAVVADKIADAYDTVPTSENYDRTFTMQRSFHFEDKDSGGSLAATLVNTAEDKYGRHYASFVLGDDHARQARVHEGRWPTARSLARETLPQYKQDLKDAIKDMVH